MKNKTNLQDFRINVKFKLSALWASVMFCYIYGDYFSLYVPGQLEGLMKGECGVGSTTPVKLVMFSLLIATPSLMIFLSLALKPTINRVLNIILGLFFTVIMGLIVVTSKDPWMIFNTVLGSIEMILTLLIVWYAWKWPKEISLELP
jgi:hypothetical protein